MSNTLTIAAKGELNITIKREGGRTDKYIVKNLVVNKGLEFIAQRMADNSTKVISHMAIGTGSYYARNDDTKLNDEVARVPVTVSVNGAVITYTAVFGQGVGTGAIVEAGLFNEDTDGLMTCRSVFQVKNKEYNDVMTINWDNKIVSY